MLKKLASFLLSLLLCLSLSVNQAKAVDAPEPADPPAQTDILVPGEPDKPDEPGIMPMGEDAPDKSDDSPNAGNLS